MDKRNNKDLPSGRGQNSGTRTNSSKRRRPYKGKPKKGNYSDDERKDYRRDKYESQETNAIGDNNPSWYIPDPMVMDQATRVSFSNFVGVPVELDPTNSLSGLGSTVLKPGAAMQVFTNPSPGYTQWDDAKSAAINQQAFRTYARLSSINAKNTQYTPNDVATIILAVGELIKMFSVAQRAYGLLWTYNVRNRLMPANLIDLSGVDSSLLVEKAADYLTEFNTLIVEANRIPFPANIEYFKHCAEMYSNVYQDSDSSMSELYVPLPWSTWDLYEDAVLEGTLLSTHNFWSEVSEYIPLDPWDLLAIIRGKIDALLSSSTYNYVYSDIINLAAKDSSVQILKFVPVDPTYAVIPVYDKEWLLKINNATIVGEPLGTSQMADPDHHTEYNDVVPNKDILTLRYAPQWIRTYPDLGFQKIMNFYDDSPTLEERVIATRLMFGSGMDMFPMKGEVKSPDPTKYYTNQTVGLGDSYIVGINVWTRYFTGAAPGYSLSTSAVDVTSLSTPSILTRFSQHPYIYEYKIVDGKMALAGLVGDLDFFTTLDFDTLARINRLALFALFDVKDVT